MSFKIFRSLLGLIAAFLFLNSITFSQQSQIQKIDSFIQKSLKEWNTVGFSVGIVKNDSVVLAKGYGLRKFGTALAVDENTQFVIASCSKAYTSAALAVLVDQKKIKWDDPVTKYIPSFQMYDPWVTKEFTIRDLLTHRSGLETFSGDFLWISSNYTTNEIISRLRYLKPTSSFRSRYGYQNLMYITAAQIVKTVTDTSWGDFIQAHFLTPLTMNNTSTSYSQFYPSENIAKGHYLKGGSINIYKDIQTDNAMGAIGINSSASDMTKWIRLQLAKGKFEGKQIFSERQSAEMFANQMVTFNGNYGLGWGIGYLNGKKTISHGGGMPGYVSDVTLLPEEKLGIVILSNQENGMVAAVKNYILDIMTGVEPKDYNKSILERWNRRLEAYDKEIKRREEIRVKDSSPSFPLEKYIGLYEDKMYGKAEVSLKEGKLFMQFIPSPTFKGELKHYQFDTFSIDWEDEFLTRGYVKFDMNFKGEITKFTLEVPNSPDFIFTELLFERAK